MKRKQKRKEGRTWGKIKIIIEEGNRTHKKMKIEKQTEEEEETENSKQRIKEYAGIQK